MTYAGGTGKVQRALSKLDGFSFVRVRLRPGIATVQSDVARATSLQTESVIGSAHTN